MILLELFLAFFKIGMFTFGGGYAMIAMIRETVLANGWLTEEQLLQFVGVAESTPGPIAVNMATFVGSSKAGVLGALFATLGVVLPSFIIILIIAIFIRNIMQKKGTQAFLGGVRPCIVALILSTGVIIGLKTLFGISTVTSKANVDFRGIIILLMLFGIQMLAKRIKGKSLSAIYMIIISAGLGLGMYGFINV